MTTRHTVMIVDDDPDIIESLTLLLEDEGFDVVSASNGAVASDKIANGLRPSSIVLDLMMPVMNGWQLWDWLQANPPFDEIPVVVLTATGLRTGSIGRAPVFEKPVEADKLLATLSQLAPG